MRILSLKIDNYKSLRDVSFDVPSLMVIVGQNAAGKSNFADALDFLAEVYRHGLEIAVARKGGYENICFRRTRRSKSPIIFSVLFEIDTEDSFSHNLRSKVEQKLYIEHTFSFRAETQAIRASFGVSEESINMSFKKDKWDLMVSRHGEDIQAKTSGIKNALTERAEHALNYLQQSTKVHGSTSTSLLFETFFYFVP